MSSTGLEIRQNRFRQGFVPDLTGGAYSAPTDPIAGGEGAGRHLLKNLTSALALRLWPYGPRSLDPKHPPKVNPSWAKALLSGILDYPP